jgi:hypothetical protein
MTITSFMFYLPCGKGPPSFYETAIRRFYLRLTGFGRIRIPETIPSAAKAVTMEEPPLLKNGSVMPMTGVMPMHMPIFSKVWKISIEAIPVHMSKFI